MLKRVGINVESVYDLVNSKAAYPEAIPALLECLTFVQEPVIKEGVIRALTVKEAKGKAEQALIQEFKLIPPDISQLQILKWTIGNALSVVATDAVFDDLVELATNKAHGKAREMVVVALGNMKNPKAGEILIGLLSDEEVAGHAAMALGKLKYRPALPHLKTLMKHPKPWVRKTAEKTIAKLLK
jgi:HEAT repeat protein